MRPDRALTRAGHTRLWRAWLVLVLLLGSLTVLATSTTAVAAGSPVPVFNCVIGQTSDGSFRAVFGYTNSGPETTVPAGPNNTLSPSGSGVQTTRFQTGSYSGTFATEFISKKNTVTWTLNGRSVSARFNSRDCGSGVTLPAEGNGIGPLVVIVLSVAGSVLLAGLGTWRQKRRRAAP